MIPVVEILRVSTEYQADPIRAGLDAQRTSNRATAAAFGLEPVATVEIVESGADVATTPEMARVVDLVRSGAARGVVLAEYSRLFRPDRWTDLAVLQTFADHDAQIYLPSGPIDLQSELGFVQATVNNLLAAMERRRIRERMDRGKEEHRRRGEHVAGGIGIPYGMAYSREAGWSYTPEVERVRELFRRYLAGNRNLAGLSRDLGIPRTSVRYVLQNEAYAGWRVYDERRDTTAAGKRTGTKDRRKTARPPAQVIRVKLPLEPVVSREDWERVQVLLEDRASMRSRESHASHFLYRGFIHCGGETCGERIYGAVKHQHGGTDRYYFCSTQHPGRKKAQAPRCENTYMRRDLLEETLDRVVVERLTDVQLIEAAVSAYAASIDAAWRSSAPDQGAVAQQRAAAEQKRRRVLSLFVDGLITGAERDERLMPIDAELRALTQLAGHIPTAPESVDASRIAEVVSVFVGWDVLAWKARREILEALMPVFYVWQYQCVGVRIPLSLDSSRGDSDSRSPTADGITTGHPNLIRKGSLYVPLCA